MIEEKVLEKLKELGFKSRFFDPVTNLIKVDEVSYFVSDVNTFFRDNYDILEYIQPIFCNKETSAYIEGNSMDENLDEDDIVVHYTPLLKFSSDKFNGLTISVDPRKLNFKNYIDAQLYNVAQFIRVVTF